MLLVLVIAVVAVAAFGVVSQSEAKERPPVCVNGIGVPPEAIQGTILVDAPVFWAPGEMVFPEFSLPAGMHVYTGGLDESGMYRQVLAVNTWVWVDAARVGPNYDAPWFGMPLSDDLLQLEGPDAAYQQACIEIS